MHVGVEIAQPMWLSRSKCRITHGMLCDSAPWLLHLIVSGAQLPDLLLRCNKASSSSFVTLMLMLPDPPAEASLPVAAVDVALPELNVVDAPFELTGVDGVAHVYHTFQHCQAWERDGMAVSGHGSKLRHASRLLRTPSHHATKTNKYDPAHRNEL